MLGVNFGRVGFLTSINGADLEAGLARVFAGDYVVLELATLDVEAGGSGRRRERRRRRQRRPRPHGGAGLADRRRGLGTVACDGVICATPTGSTAYNLSNGGPVLVWGLDAMAVTFVAPHSLHARSLVVPATVWSSCRNETLDVGVTVLVDGHELTGLETGATVSVQAR